MNLPFLGISTIDGVEGEHSTPYMTRILCGRLRLHIFHRGDADPDCHDHPWDFWTFPLTAYVEEVVTRKLEADRDYDAWTPRALIYSSARRVVPALRWSFRPAEHMHRVIGRADGRTGKVVTVVWQGKPRRKWGFLRNRDGKWCWTPWKDYVFGGGKHAPCEPSSRRDA